MKTQIQETRKAVISIQMMLSEIKLMINDNDKILTGKRSLSHE